MKFLGFGKDTKTKEKEATKVDVQPSKGGKMSDKSNGEKAAKITKEERDFQAIQVRQHRYAIELQGEKEDLRKAAAIAARKAVEANTAEVKGHIAQEKFNQAGFQLQAAKIDTQRASLAPKNAQTRLGMAESKSNLLQVQSKVQQAKDKLKERNFNLLVGGEK